MSTRRDFLKQAGVLGTAAAMYASSSHVFADDAPAAATAEDPNISYTVSMSKDLNQTPAKRKITVPNVTLPEIGEVQVLKGDFHMHTLLSDGQVWPHQRVIEADGNGLDVISITDHIEYRPYVGGNGRFKLSDRMTELEKEIAIHDYLAGNVRYERTGDVADAYSALLLGVAKCTGYSDAFYLLASMAGLEVAKMPGYADDERHEWNAIRLGGLWYFVDVTWDAPDPRAVGRYSRAYLNLPPAMMRDTHSWDSRNEPGALATVLDTNNYYASRGLVAQDADALIGVAVDSLRVGQPLSLLYPAGLSVDTVAQAAVEAVAQVSGAGSYRAAYRSQPMGGWQYVEMTLLRE